MYTAAVLTQSERKTIVIVLTTLQANTRSLKNSRNGEEYTSDKTMVEMTGTLLRYRVFAGTSRAISLLTLNLSSDL